MATRRCEACGCLRNHIEDICCRECGRPLPDTPGAEQAATPAHLAATADTLAATRPSSETWARLGVLLTAVATMALAVVLVVLAVRSGHAAGR
jgi:hypothetical protein